MELKINLKDDDLNKEIKKLVYHHVKSLVRGEVHKLLNAEIQKKIGALSKERLQNTMDQSVRVLLRNAINPVWNSSPVKTEIKRQIQDLVQEALSENKDKVEELLKAEIERKMKQIVGPKVVFGGRG